MRAVVVTRHGGSEVLQVHERPEPPVPPGHVRIAVRAAGVNFADLMARSGIYPDAPRPPCVLGYEVAGEIESIGQGVAGFAVGDRVVAATRFGGQAELVSVPVADVWPLPAGWTFEEGAALLVNYGTAYAALVVLGGLRAGERGLIHAAAGGVGIAATQIGRSIGAELFGTASAAKHALIRDQGIAHPIDYHSVDFEAEVRRLTQGQGVDVVIDATGPRNYRKDYRLLRPGGRLVMFGLSEAQGPGRRDLGALFGSLLALPFATMPWWTSAGILNENKGVSGLNLLAWWKRERTLDRLAVAVLRLLESEAIRPVVAATFPFERAADAHRFIHERRNVGKVVLVPG
jgi:NADPH:quinone reductase-like Zn-dependent oxidoreductase